MWQADWDQHSEAPHRRRLYLGLCDGEHVTEVPIRQACRKWSLIGCCPAGARCPMRHDYYVQACGVVFPGLLGNPDRPWGCGVARCISGRVECAACQSARKDYSPGERVVARALRRAQELNGREGVVQGAAEGSDGRLLVDFSPTQRHKCLKSIRAAQLCPAAPEGARRVAWRVLMALDAAFGVASAGRCIMDLERPAGFLGGPAERFALGSMYCRLRREVTPDELDDVLARIEAEAPDEGPEGEPGQQRPTPVQMLAHARLIVPSGLDRGWDNGGLELQPLSLQQLCPQQGWAPELQGLLPERAARRVAAAAWALRRRGLPADVAQHALTLLPLSRSAMMPAPPVSSSEQQRSPPSLPVRAGDRSAAGAKGQGIWA